MSLKRISTILLHTWYHFLHSMETWADILWIPILQLLVFIFLSLALFGHKTPQGDFMIMGMIFWNIIGVAQYGVSVGALWEIWSRSFSSLFITPLTIEEFLAGQMLASFIKALVAFVLAALLGYLMTGFSVLVFGFMLPIYIVSMIIFAWGVGMLGLSLIFRFGTDVQALSWTMVYFIQPLGGIFYSLDALPPYVRWVGQILPTSYIFDSMRRQLSTGIIAWDKVGIAFVLGCVYFLVGYMTLKLSFIQSQKSGAFARMEG